MLGYPKHYVLPQKLDWLYMEPHDCNPRALEEEAGLTQGEGKHRPVDCLNSNSLCYTQVLSHSQPPLTLARGGSDTSDIYEHQYLFTYPHT